ncbi:MAG: DUF6879 family protein [Pseudonocardiaceae bacterium]
MLDLPALGAYLTQRHTRDLFRLETLAHYDAASDDEDYHRYLRGESAPTAAGKETWLGRLRTDTAAGRRWRRVHVVTPPLTDYLRYECEWGYTHNVAAGEDVRILDLSASPAGAEVLGVVGDFFVADEEHAVRMDYDEAGRFRGAVPVDPLVLAPYQAVAVTVWTLGVPFTTWWAQHPEYHRSGQAA